MATPFQIKLREVIEIERENIWYIGLTFKRLGCEKRTCAAGFSVMGKKILTCYQMFEDKEIIQIRARNSTMGRPHIYEMEICHKRPEWNMAELVFKQEAPEKWTCCQFANDGKLDVGEELFYMTANYSVVSGRVAFPCVDIPDLDMLDRDPQDDISLNLSYIVMGNAPGYINVFHSLVPVIQCGGSYVGSISHGGPLFNINGEIVGMVFGNHGSYPLALHSSVLKKFLQEDSDDTEYSAKVVDDEE